MDKADIFRPPEIEAWSNRIIIHPLSFLLAKALAKTRMTPNMVSLLGIPLGIVAAICFALYSAGWWWGLIGGFAALIRLIADGADGQLARIKNLSSPFGRVLDGICDYIAIGAIYLSFLVAFHGWQNSLIFLLLLFSYFSRIIQANVYELQRSLYRFWTAGKTDGLPASLLNQAPKHYARNRFLNSLISVLDHQYGQSQLLFSGLSKDKLKPKLCTYLNSSTKQQAELAKQYDQRYRKLVKFWGILNDNCHYLLLTIFCVIQQPIWYFLAELTVLNILQISFLCIYRRKINNIKTTQ